MDKLEPVDGWPSWAGVHGGGPRVHCKAFAEIELRHEGITQAVIDAVVTDDVLRRFQAKAAATVESAFPSDGLFTASWWHRLRHLLIVVLCREIKAKQVLDVVDV